MKEYIIGRLTRETVTIIMPDENRRCKVNPNGTGRQELDNATAIPSLF